MWVRKRGSPDLLPAAPGRVREASVFRNVLEACVTKDLKRLLTVCVIQSHGRHERRWRGAVVVVDDALKHDDDRSRQELNDHFLVLWVDLVADYVGGISHQDDKQAVTLSLCCEIAVE